MFIPLHDDNPLRSISAPYVTVALIAINVIVYVFFQSGLVYNMGQAGTFDLAIIPCQLLRVESCVANSGHLTGAMQELITPFSYMFLHGGWMHLIGNMSFLWVFADNVEDSFGHLSFLLFYLVCGLVAALAHLALDPASRMPLIGASGAISGVIASYLLLFPRSQVISLFGFVPLKLPAMWLLGMWILFNLVFFLVAPASGGVAWVTHLAGFVTGLAITWPLRKRIRLRLARGQARRDRPHWDAARRAASTSPARPDKERRTS